MAATYALLAGINAYQAVPSLRGCRNDLARAAEHLRANSGNRLSVVELCDGQATKAAVVDAFRRHLGQAGPGDTALFWFSGHGSTARVPPELWHLEPTGEMQTILCADSRTGTVTDLVDKELAVLIHEVASGGAHVTVVLDCCHAGGGTREQPEPEPGVRMVEPLAAPPPVEWLLPELRSRDAESLPAVLTGGGSPDHVFLAACHSYQRAHERPLGGEVRGVFSWALLGALRQLGPTSTYRELLTAARCSVENVRPHQVPELYPVDGGLADQPFLGGRLRTPVTAMVMRFVRRGWEINVGACHGLAAAGDDLRVAVHGSDPAQEARVVEIHTERSVVQPVGWHPDRSRQYPVVLTSVPLPPTAVAVGDAPAVARAIQVAGPRGGPSPYVRVGEPAELLVTAPDWGRLQICDPEGTALAPESSDPAGVVASLEHIARWRQVKALANPLSQLAGAVDIEVVAPLPGERVAPLGRPPLPVGADGALHLAYQEAPTGWVAPTVFIRLRNRGGRRLYCVLLDLTDRFRMHARLLPGASVSPGWYAAALEGGLVEFTLPPDRPVVPGARVRDWLVLLVAETEFSAEPFQLPRLDEPAAPATPAASTRAAGLTGVLGRLGFLAVHRDADRPAAAAYDWATRVLPVITTVPGGSSRAQRWAAMSRDLSTSGPGSGTNTVRR